MKNLILSLLLPALSIPTFSQAFEAEAIISKPDYGGTFRQQDADPLQDHQGLHGFR